MNKLIQFLLTGFLFSLFLRCSSEELVRPMAFEILKGEQRFIEEVQLLNNPQGILPPEAPIQLSSILYKSGTGFDEYFVYDEKVTLILLSKLPVYFLKIQSRDFAFRLTAELTKIKANQSGEDKDANGVNFYKQVGDYSVEIYFTPNDMRTSTSGKNKGRIQDRTTSHPEVDLWRLYGAADDAVFYTPSFDDQQIQEDFAVQRSQGKKRLIFTNQATVGNPINYNTTNKIMNFSWMIGSNLQMTEDLLSGEDINFLDQYEVKRDFAAFFSLPIGNNTDLYGTGTDYMNTRNGIVVIFRGDVKRIQEFMQAEDFNLNEEPNYVVKTPAKMLITEVEIEGSTDKIEFVVTEAGYVDGMRVFINDTLRYIFPSAQPMSVGDIVLLNLGATGTDDTGGNPATNGVATAFDFWISSSALSSTNGEINLTNTLRQSIDYMGWSTQSEANDTQLGRVQAFVDNANWVKDGSSLKQTDLVDADQDSAGNCLQRHNSGAATSFTDSNSVDDWRVGTCALGQNQDSSPPPFAALTTSVNQNSTTLVVTFNAKPNAADAVNLNNYCIALAVDIDCSSPDLNVNSSSVNGKVVTLRTSAQLPASGYKIYFNNIKRKFDGQLIAVNSSLSFLGFKPAGKGDIVINEIGVSSPGSNDFVELFNKTASPIDLADQGLFLQRDSSCDLSNGITEKLALTGILPANGYFVVANSGHSLANVNQANLGNVASGYCVVLTIGSSDVTAPANTQIIDWVTIAGSGTIEGGSRGPDTTTNGAISRIPNGTDTDLNAADFIAKPVTPGSMNGSPTFVTTPANGSSNQQNNTNLVLTFNESMNTGFGSVNAVGANSGAQNGLTCAWSTSVVANDRCTINPADFNDDGELITVTLVGFQNVALGLGPATTSFSFNVLNAALAPVVTNVTVTSTNPNNGIIPYNIGTTTVTITGQKFTGVSCPSGVRLDNTNGLNSLVNTVVDSCTVDSDTQITAVFPAGIKANPVTGWHVQVNNGNGMNLTSAVTFKPRSGILISEVLFTGAATTNEFVELYNPTDNSINLCTISGGSQINLRRRTAAGGDSALASFLITNCTIPSHGFFLAISGVSTAIWNNYDATFTAALAASNMVYISRTGDLSGVLDLVGWGTITDSTAGGGCEGGNTNCANLTSANNSIERKPAGGTGHATDTNVNSSDFNAQSATTTPRGTIDAVQP